MVKMIGICLALYKVFSQTNNNDSNNIWCLSVAEYVADTVQSAFQAHLILSITLSHTDCYYPHFQMWKLRRQGAM